MKLSLFSLLRGCFALLLTLSNAHSAEFQNLPWLKVSPDKTHFVEANTGNKFVIWGVNYDHNDGGLLLEDYWHDDWNAVVEDFQEIKALGCNVVRIHLQLGQTMKTAQEPDPSNLKQLAKLLKLAEETGLYLDLTGLACYHKQDVPDWYDGLSESDRWDVQCRFWKAIAGVYKDSPAVFCYDLMNEPVLAGKAGNNEWLTGNLGGKYFVQRITLDLKGRDRKEVAKAWVAKLCSAIREVDNRHLITVGVIPWALPFKGAKPLFHDREVGKPLDFVSVHFYPTKGEVDKAIEALKVYEVGKPLVIEEMFPLKSGMEDMDSFIQQSRSFTDGWISFYWGKTIEQCKNEGDIKGAILAGWLEYWQQNAPK
ncbi:MAG: cellulase family glycosylhydrolase [Pirellulales bacterium]